MLNVFMFLRSFVAERLRRDDRGVTMVEYGILVAVIALVVIAGATIFGNALSTFFSNLAGKL